MKKTISIFFILLLFSISGCDLFSTREPELPENRQSNWIPPLSPDQVILNLQNSFYERIAENFIRCLVDTAYSEAVYVFDPDPEVAVEYFSVFENWSLQNEEAVIRQLFSIIPDENTAFLVFSEENWELYGSENAIYAAQYRLELHHTQPGIDSVFQGFLIYHLSPDNRGEWSVTQWIDNGISGSESWSRLKAVFGG